MTFHNQRPGPLEELDENKYHSTLTNTLITKTYTVYTNSDPLRGISATFERSSTNKKARTIHPSGSCEQGNLIEGYLTVDW